jgi:2-dehydropantoate 2-reductase
MQKIKVLVVGIGGVGGYYGGKLARAHEGSESVEIHFLTRGANLEQIRQNGLKVITSAETFHAIPHQVSDNADEFGKVDYVLLCTKTYDLESVLQQIKPCITEETVIVPLLNGVGNEEMIRIVYPNSFIAAGCTYLVSRLTAPGEVSNTGNIQKIFFGSESVPFEHLSKLEGLFQEAQIDAKPSTEIQSILWEKFIFLSPTATATSYYDQSLGALFEAIEKVENIRQLIHEVHSLAQHNKINLPENIVELTLAKMKALPYDTTSSMHSDFKSGKGKTELESLTGYVISESEKHNLSQKMYPKMYEYLFKKGGRINPQISI